jgi:predicted metalloenzyme YecM
VSIAEPKRSDWLGFVDQKTYFGENIRFYLKELEILDQVKTLRADHAGVRFKDKASVDLLRMELLEQGSLISSASVNGREIFLFELDEPISIAHWTISCIELPYPKPDHAYADGWEHIEFVIPSAATNIAAFRKDFQAMFPNIRKEGTYKESLPDAQGDQRPNPTIVLSKSPGITVKFHPRSIQEVVGFTTGAVEQAH